MTQTENLKTVNNQVSFSQVTMSFAGTTWTQEMVWLICHDADTEGAKAANIMERFPMIDEPEGTTVKLLPKTPSPRYIKSHLPFCLMPVGILNTKAKVEMSPRGRKLLSNATSFFLHKKVF